PPATPNPSVKVLDSANTINDPAWFTKAYAAGFRLYIMHSTAWGTCTPWYNTQPQLGMALAAGLKIAVYTRDPNCWQGGISAAGPYQSQLQFFALDVETGGPVVTRDMVDGVKAMGVRPVIYTGSGMWPQMTDNSTAFSDVPLWDTNARNINYKRWIADYLSPLPCRMGAGTPPRTCGSVSSKNSTKASTESSSTWTPSTPPSSNRCPRRLNPASRSPAMMAAEMPASPRPPPTKTPVHSARGILDRSRVYGPDRDSSLDTGAGTGFRTPGAVLFPRRCLVFG
ncbi:hypothetical protein AHiyo6_37330, partial [Arthrobacter sp. Hiyo6]